MVMRNVLVVKSNVVFFGDMDLFFSVYGVGYNSCKFSDKGFVFFLYL